jgi:hypothetical protein
MHKLKLAVEDLTVESFEVRLADRPKQGTFFANSYTQPDWATCEPNTMDPGCATMVGNGCSISGACGSSADMACDNGCY